jgi:Tfp pilus assembly protein PilF
MVTQASHKPLGAALVAALLLVVALPASAETLEELDGLVEASAKPVAGLNLARAQADAGSLLDALATLERVLAIDPKHKQARLLHASLLCRADDAAGAAYEFGKLKSGSYKKAEWASAIAPCNKTGATR